MFEQPQEEHEWLAQLVGEWRTESECHMAPGEPAQKVEGRLAARLLGGLWLIAEGEGDAPDGSKWGTVMTLGYDAREKRYVGSFIAGMMTKFWVYDGAVDASAKKLVLNTEGPTMDGKGTTKYIETVEILDKNHWTFSSKMFGEDGQWHHLMTADHYRK